MIPDEAVEAAYDALPIDSYVAGLDHIRAMLDAAAPSIRAQALEEAAQALPFMNRPVTRLVRHVAVADWLRSRVAAEWRGEQR